MTWLILTHRRRAQDLATDLAGGKEKKKICLGKCINIQKVMLPKHLEQMHTGTTAVARVRGCGENSAGWGGGVSTKDIGRKMT